MKKLLLAVLTGAVIGAAGIAFSQSTPWDTAEFNIALGLTVSACGAESLTPGNYSQITMDTTGNSC